MCSSVHFRAVHPLSFYPHYLKKEVVIVFVRDLIYA